MIKKSTLIKSIAVFAMLPIVIFACGNSHAVEANSKETTNTSSTDTSYLGVIKAMWWDNGYGAGMLNFYNAPADIELWVVVKDGELAVNPEAQDMFKWTGSGRNPNSKYLNKKVKVTYWKKPAVGEPKRHNIKTIEVLGEEIPKLPAKTFIGFITEVTTKDSTCLTLQKNFDEPVVDIFRMYVNEENLLKVNTDAVKDIFTYKNYSCQLNPKSQGRKIKVTCEPVILTDRSAYNGQTRMDKFYGYAVTKIEPAN